MRHQTGWRTCWPLMVRARDSLWHCCCTRSAAGGRGDAGGAQDRGGLSADRPGAPAGPDRVHDRRCRTDRRDHHRRAAVRLDGCDLAVIDIDDPAVDTQPSTALPAPARRTTSPTSSTPRAPPVCPKGVAITHHNLTHLAESLPTAPAGGAGVDAVSFLCASTSRCGRSGLRCSVAAGWWSSPRRWPAHRRTSTPCWSRTGQCADPDPVCGGGAVAAGVGVGGGAARR